MRYSCASAVSGLLLSLLFDSSASAVTIDWTFVGDPGNQSFVHATPSYGAVSYAYSIGTYEVTNAQYAEFLNAAAVADPHGLYDPRMGDPSTTTYDPRDASYGGVTRSGSSGSYTYAAIAGRENMPVNWIGFYDAIRFANWLNNGQGSADTETGSYTLQNATEIPGRNSDASIFLPSIDEWHKAAFYDASSQSYFLFPAGSHQDIRCDAPTSIPNSANCDPTPYVPGLNADDLTPVGSFPGSPSPYGTFDQAGNVSEWADTAPDYDGNQRWVLGGDFSNVPWANSYAVRSGWGPNDAAPWVGFRVASSIPEPGTGLLVIGGLLGLAGWRRARA